MAKKTVKDNTINIKQSSIQGHIGANKLINNDWKTIAFSFPREQLNAKFTEEELRYNGIYFLFGYENGKEVVYIGQASKRANGESFLARLREHNDSVTESYRDKWSWVVAITNEGDTWGATELNALESIFINEIPIESSLNGRKQNNGGADLTYYEDKVTQIKALITAVGFTIFNDIADEENINIIDETVTYGVVEDLQKGMTRIPEIVTPQRVVKQMVDTLPADIWNSKTKFIDIACKGGEYLREIYDRLMETEVMQSLFPNIIERSNHILKNQIYGIALSQVSLERTTKKLLGEDRNIKVIPQYIDIIKLRNKDLINKAINKEFGENMNFDVVIGNPPYQESTGSGLNGSGGTALFDKFIICGVNITNRLLCMITPAKWAVGGQSDFKKVRDKLLDGNHITKMVDYMDATAIFPGRSIAGGVSYFLYDRSISTKTEFTTVLGTKYTSYRTFSKDEIIPRHDIGDKVIKKIKAIDRDYLSDHVFKNKWNFGTDFNSANVIKDTEDDITIVTPRGNYYCNSTEYGIYNAQYYKLMFTRAITGHAGSPDKDNKYKVLSSLRILEPYEICNASYMVVDGINKREYAENIKAYLETKFVRFLILQTIFGIGLTPDRFRFVPMQDFRQVWTDKMLYEKYNLSSEEIEFIENIIRPMDSASATQKPKFTLADAEAAYINKLINSQ